MALLWLIVPTLLVSFLIAHSTRKASLGVVHFLLANLLAAPALGVLLPRIDQVGDYDDIEAVIYSLLAAVAVGNLLSLFAILGIRIMRRK